MGGATCPTVATTRCGSEHCQDKGHEAESPTAPLQVKHRLQKAVSQAVQRLEKKVQSLQKQGGQSDKHLRTKKLADLLMANVHRCVPWAATRHLPMLECQLR